MLRMGSETKSISLVLGSRPTLEIPRSQLPLSSPEDETLPGEDGKNPEQRQEFSSLFDDLFNQCVKLLGNGICGGLFGR